MKILFSLSFLLFIGCTPVNSKAQKHKFLQKTVSHKKAGKVRSSLTVEIKDVSQNDQTLDLRANINPNMVMAGATIEWKIPEGSSIVAGNSTSTMDLNPGSLEQIQVSLDRDKLKDNDQIFLFVYIMRNGERLGGTSSFVYHKKDEDNKEESEELNQKVKQTPRMVE